MSAPVPRASARRRTNVPNIRSVTYLPAVSAVPFRSRLGTSHRPRTEFVRPVRRNRRWGERKRSDYYAAVKFIENSLSVAPTTWCLSAPTPERREASAGPWMSSPSTMGASTSPSSRRELSSADGSPWFPCERRALVRDRRRPRQSRQSAHFLHGAAAAPPAR